MAGEAETEINKRTDTLSSILVSVTGIVIALLTILTILPEFGVNITTLIAGLGVGGLAIAFAAQNLVRDFITGFFILLEDQYRVGDVVTVAGIAGVVEEIGLRRTVLRDLDGIVHSVPNGKVEISSNMTKKFSRVNMDISVGYGEPAVIIMTAIRIATATTDPCGFENWGFSYQRDVEPGEIVLLRNGYAETKGIIPSAKTQICTFVWIYSNFPNALFKNIPVSGVRKKLGAILARQDIERGFIPHIVAPVPDSGRFCAIGYHQEFCRQINEKKIDRIPEYDEVLIKHPYAGRSYPRSNQVQRDLEAHIKQLGSGEKYHGKIVVVCDDSIRRGT
ncbi:mechanosensitive ion channel domain-containing protein, partial [Chloroflexota bacterium]